MPTTSLYAIVDWDTRYENNRTREMKVMQWVPVPNKHDGDGYTELLDHANGAAHFACWVTILQVASRCQPRGTLLRDNGSPHDSGSLARITRIPRQVFDEALPRLVSIGWLSSQVVDSQEVAGACGIPAPIPQEGASSLRGIEGNGMEQKGREETPLTPHGGIVPSPPKTRSDPTPYDGMVAAWNDGRGRLPGIVAPPGPSRLRLLKRAWTVCLAAGSGDRTKASEVWALVVQRASEDAYYVESGRNIDTVCRKIDRFLDEPSSTDDTDDDEPEETVDDYCRRCISELEWNRMTDAEREGAREWAKTQLEASR